MPVDIVIPKASLTMTEGTLIEWLKNDGEMIQPGDHVAHIETDKVVLPVEVEKGGTLVQVLRAGVTVPIATIIGYLLEDGETRKDIPETVVNCKVEKKDISQLRPSQEKRPSRSRDYRISPLARKAARDLGVDPDDMAAVGYTGKISVEDVKQFVGNLRSEELDSTPAASSVASLPEFTNSVPFTGLRRLIAENMLESVHTSAAVTLHAEVDGTTVIRLREVTNKRNDDKKWRLSYDAILVKAVALALRDHPRVNSRLVSDRIEELNERNIAVAVDTPRGLYTVVIHRADEKDLLEIAEELNQKVARIQDGNPHVGDLEGSTFTVTNLGMNGITFFTPIIQSGQCAILGVGKFSERVVFEDDQAVQKSYLNLSLTFDHRIIDGAPAARFLSEVCEYLCDAETQLL